jgi:hypothetical protein
LIAGVIVRFNGLAARNASPHGRALFLVDDLLYLRLNIG